VGHLNSQVTRPSVAPGLLIPANLLDSPKASDNMTVQVEGSAEEVAG
jgi:hypothetical protein